MGDLATALAQYRHAESQLRHRKDSVSGTSAAEARALTFIYAAADADALPTAKQIGAHLGISSASVTALVDRLTLAGLVVRAKHPTDRRCICIRPVGDRIAPNSLAGLTGRMNALAAAYRGRDAAMIAGFLTQLTSLIADEATVDDTARGAAA